MFMFMAQHQVTKKGQVLLIFLAITDLVHLTALHCGIQSWARSLYLIL